MAGSAAFEITLTEASSENAVVCAAGVVEALQTVIARRVDPLQPALVTVAAVQTLEEPKPASVRLLGQFHATDPGVFASLFASVRFVATGAAATRGCGGRAPEVLEILDDGAGGISKLRWDADRKKVVREPVEGAT